MAKIVDKKELLFRLRSILLSGTKFEHFRNAVIKATSTDDVAAYLKTLTELCGVDGRPATDDDRAFLARLTMEWKASNPELTENGLFPLDEKFKWVGTDGVEYGGI